MTKNDFRTQSPPMTLEQVYRMVVSYRDMRQFCMERSDCMGCSYYNPDATEWIQSGGTVSACDRVTTDDILDIASDYFRALLSDTSS